MDCNFSPLSSDGLRDQYGIQMRQEVKLFTTIYIKIYKYILKYINIHNMTKNFFIKFNIVQTYSCLTIILFIESKF